MFERRDPPGSGEVRRTRSWAVPLRFAWQAVKTFGISELACNAQSFLIDRCPPPLYLYGTSEVDWFRVRNQDWIDAWQIRDDISPEEHVANAEDCIWFRSAYLSSCLQISEVGDSAVILLNPEIVNDEGEWETWCFASWYPGAARYPSFRAYVESELQSLKHPG